MIQLYNGDCLEEMDNLISKGVQVDAIITDPPYGTTACKWDSVIPFDEMWERLNKLIKPNGAIVLFGSEPFSSALRMSNIKNYKYDWVWDKKLSTGFLNSKRMPLKQHEIISIFYKKQCTYNPQMIKGKERTKGGKLYNKTSIYGNYHVTEKETYNMYYPTSIKVCSNSNRKNKVHPTQKPVALMEYLIKTYTNENELVLDFTMGSGSTGVACKNLNRDFIGIELDENYFNIAQERINKPQQIKLF